MGTSIVTCLVRHGYRVIGLDQRPAATAKAIPAVRRALRELRAPARRLKNFRTTTQLADLRDCDFVIEAIVEKLADKQALIAALEDVVSRHTVIASNTSAIPVTLLQSKARHPDRVVGLHWAEPAHITRFMEIIGGKQTSAATRRRAATLATRCGKEPSVLKKDIRGFITNRIMYAMLREAFHLVEQGVCTIADVDRSLRNDLGWWITLAGPFRFMDLTGVPAYELVMRDLLPELSNAKAVPALMRQTVAGRKKFYRYTPAQARAWERKFIRFSHDIRRLALRYPDHGQ